MMWWPLVLRDFFECSFHIVHVTVEEFVCRDKIRIVDDEQEIADLVALLFGE